MNLDSVVFYTKNIEKIADFYTNLMGFKLHSRQGDKFVSFIFPNGAKLSIRLEEGERESAGHQAAFINCEEVKEKFQELKEKGANIPVGIEERDWGTKFDLLDPDDNKIVFIKWKN